MPIINATGQNKGDFSTRSQYQKYSDENDGYFELAARIVRQAFKDLRKSYFFLYIGRIKKSPTMDDVKKFLASSWYHTLCDIDPYAIDEKAREDAQKMAEIYRKYGYILRDELDED